MVGVGGEGAQHAHGDACELVPAHAVRGDHWRVPLTAHAVAPLLARLLADPRSRATIQAQTGGAGLWELVRAVETGWLVVVRAMASARHDYGARATGPAEPDEPADASPAVGTGSHWVALRVVDDDSAEPVAALDLVVALPDGSERSVTTDGDGRVELQAEAGGSCDVRARPEAPYFTRCVTFVGTGRPAGRPPQPAATTRAPVPRGRPTRPGGKRALVDVLELRVRDGDTWETIAEAHGVAPAALMRFNFDTADPAAIQVAMSEHLGCWRRDPDSGRLVFSGDDDPGILLVPRPWQTSVTTGREHTLRVRAVRAPARPYLFSV